MGGGSADDIIQGNRAERVPNSAARVLGRLIFFLRDGRTADVLQAIQEHKRSPDFETNRFNKALTPAQQQDLVELPAIFAAAEIACRKPQLQFTSINLNTLATSA